MSIGTSKLLAMASDSSPPKESKDNYGPDHCLITRTLESYRERSL